VFVPGSTRKVLDWEALEAHPAADLFPLMEGEEFEKLVASIRDRGFYADKPIVLYNNKVLDGRNRLNVCRWLKQRGEPVEALFIDWAGDGSPTDWVVATNLDRRHLDATQKAFVGLKLLPLYEAEARERQLARLKQGAEAPVPENIPERGKGEAREKAAAAVGVNAHYLSDAKKIQEADPELAELAGQGQIGITDAKQLLKVAQAAPELAAAVKQKIETIREEKAGDPDAAKKAIKQEIEGAVHEQKRRARPDFNAAGALPEGQYNTLLADPPWSYDFSPEESNAIENHYPTMDLEVIKALPVAPIAAEDSVLFLWVTSPKLEQGLAVLNAWGFRYVTSWIWQKTGGAPGMGYWARIDHEILLIGVNGNPGAPDKADMQFSSIVTAAKGKHSEKPEIFYELIEQVKPNFKRIELFARAPREGWDSWGNQVEEMPAGPD
jgi:N6-adenosine-specific RNA methylase IME4